MDGRHRRFAKYVSRNLDIHTDQSLVQNIKNVSEIARFQFVEVVS